MEATYLKLRYLNDNDVLEAEIIASIGSELLYFLSPSELKAGIVFHNSDNFEHGVVFFDNNTTEKIIDVFERYNIIIKKSNITNELIDGTLENEKLFKDLFDSNYNQEILNDFLKSHLNTDSILDKIIKCGLNSLKSFEKDFLDQQ